MLSERDQRVVAYACEGYAPRVVGTLTNLAPDTVSDILRRAREKGYDVPRFGAGRPEGAAARIVIDRSLLRGLERHARRRGQTVRALLTELLEVCLFDGRIDELLAPPAKEG